MPHEPKALREASHATAAAYIASGIDPDKSSIFMQSHVPGHSELTWLLGCYTPLGWLERMIQFKARSHPFRFDCSSQSEVRKPSNLFHVLSDMLTLYHSLPFRGCEYTLCNPICRVYTAKPAMVLCLHWSGIPFLHQQHVPGVHEQDACMYTVHTG